MHATFKYIDAIARNDLPVLITGETGVGKELIAAAIHKLSGREGEFVSVNIAGLDDHLFSDTLFGHRKGAFTGADIPRKGLIERAANGTLFLDEIGDLHVESQVKLLRLLQESSYYALGDDFARLSNARLVFATNRENEFLSNPETFRADLYYRLQPHHIHLPPLRERLADIPMLFVHFLESAAARLEKQTPTPPPELITLLGTYHFPGNIRELEGLIRDAVSQHKSGVLSTASFRQEIGEHPIRHLSKLTQCGGENSGGIRVLTIDIISTSIRAKVDAIGFWHYFGKMSIVSHDGMTPKDSRLADELSNVNDYSVKTHEVRGDR